VELDGERESLVFDQENPETLWCGSREAATVIARDPAALSPPAARLAILPAGHPQGYGDCFDAFVADAYASILSGEKVDGLPGFADGVRAAELTDAVLSSAAGGGWVDVASKPVGAAG
jgi:predicted dehydrogenase